MDFTISITDATVLEGITAARSAERPELATDAEFVQEVMARWAQDLGRRMTKAKAFVEAGGHTISRR